MNLRRDVPHIIRRPNRPDPIARIPRRKPDVFRHDDGTVSLAYLTPAQARRIRDLAVTDVHLFGLVWALDEMLGIEHEDVA